MNDDIILAARKEATEVLDSRTLSGNVWNLCDEHFAKVVAWLWARLTLTEVEELCRTELKLPAGKAPSKSALGRFWQQRSGFRRILCRQNRLASRDAAAEIAGELRKKPSNYGTANIELIHQAAFEMLSDGADPESLKPFIQAVVKLNSLEHDKDKLRKAHQDKINAGLEELAKELPAELMEKIRVAVDSKEGGK